jgi:hypothetical protein
MEFFKREVEGKGKKENQVNFQYDIGIETTSSTG